MHSHLRLSYLYLIQCHLGPRKAWSQANQPFELFMAVEDTPKLLDLLTITTSTTQKAIFIKSLLETLPTAFKTYDKQTDDLFSLFTTWFGCYPDSDATFAGTSAALQHRQWFILENRFKKPEFISEIGLDWTAEKKSQFFSKVDSACYVIKKSSFLC